MKRLVIICFAASALLAIATKLGAFVPFWNNDQHLAVGSDMEVNDADFPEGAVFHEEIQGVTNFWNNVTGSSYDLDHATYNTNGLAITLFPNLRNEIHRGNLPDGVLGRATQTAIGSHTDECDININDDPTDNNGNDLDWSAIAPSPAGKVPLPLVVLHELGHCTGLDHNDSRANTMFSVFNVGDEGPWIGEGFDAEPGEDERDWIRFIHSDATTGHNVAMTTWSCCSGGEPSNFIRTVTTDPVAGTTSVSFDFGYLNLGTFDETNVMVEYRIIPQSNPVWSAGTTVDTTSIGAVNSNAPFEFTKIVEFEHPGDECYHIGAFIDSNFAITENNENNNKVISRWTVCP